MCTSAYGTRLSLSNTRVCRGRCDCLVLRQSDSHRPGIGTLLDTWRLDALLFRVDNSRLLPVDELVGDLVCRVLLAGYAEDLDQCCSVVVSSVACRYDFFGHLVRNLHGHVARRFDLTDDDLVCCPCEFGCSDDDDQCREDRECDREDHHARHAPKLIVATIALGAGDSIPPAPMYRWGNGGIGFWLCCAARGFPRRCSGE